MTPDTKTILAIDTALGRGSVAITRGDTCLAAQTEDNPRALAERLVPMIEGALAEAEANYDTLDRVGVVTGPGTFTGLRIGLATARGLMLASGVPAFGVTSLTALAATYHKHATRDERLIVAQDARRGQVFIQHFDPAAPHPNPLDAPAAVNIDALETHLATAESHTSTVIVGSAAGIVKDQAPVPGTVRSIPHTTDIDIMALARYVAARPTAPSGTLPPPRPFYLRAPDAKLPGGRTPPARPGGKAAV